MYTTRLLAVVLCCIAAPVLAQSSSALNLQLPAPSTMPQTSDESVAKPDPEPSVTPYAMSGEINSTVDDVPGAYTRVVDAFTGRGSFDELDGLTITGTVGQDEPFWWFSVRPSNTEPLLRLNVEAGDEPTMARVRDEVLGLIRG